MTKRKATAPTRLWDGEGPWEDPGSGRVTLEALSPEEDFIDTGLLDRNGKPIMRQTRRPLGFVHFA